MDASTFDPRNQTFFILGRPNGTDGAHQNIEDYLIPISMAVIDAQRVRLANTSINYGVQLGLCLLSLLVTLLLLPSRKLRRQVHLAQVLCLVVSITRLVLLVLYFPGPLTEYYVAWTRDAGILQEREYNVIMASAALGVLQLALVEAALALQSRVLVRTWGSCPNSKNAGARTTGPAPCWWRPPILLLAVLLPAVAVGVRAVWVAHYTKAVRGHTLPVPLDAWGQAAVILGALSVFYFCGVFFAHLALHLATTRRVLRGGGGRLRKFSITLVEKGGDGERRRGLTSLEILAVGNGILMLAPCLFAGLDIAAGPGNTRVLPFDAGSWVQTIVAAGLPLISVAAFYRGSDSATSRLNSRVNRLRSEGNRWPEQDRSIYSNSNSHYNDSSNRRHRRASSFVYNADGTLPFSLPVHLKEFSMGKAEETEDVATLTGSSRLPTRSRSGTEASRNWAARMSTNTNGGGNMDDLEAGRIEESRIGPDGEKR